MKRQIAIACLFAFTAFPAAAQFSAVGTWSETGAGYSSFESIDCAQCRESPAAQADVPAPGGAAETSSIVEIDGRSVLRRTDSMLGGSPVTTYTSTSVVFGGDAQTADGQDETPEAQSPVVVEANDAPALVGAAALPEGEGEDAGQTIDRDLRTSSLGGGQTLETFELRLN